MKSILNDEYIEIIKEIDEHLVKARNLYNSLPDVIKYAESEFQRNGGNNAGLYITNGRNSFYYLAKEFEIDLDQYSYE